MNLRDAQARRSSNPASGDADSVNAGVATVGSAGEAEIAAGSTGMAEGQKQAARADQRFIASEVGAASLLLPQRLGRLHPERPQGWPDTRERTHAHHDNRVREQ